MKSRQRYEDMRECRGMSVYSKAGYKIDLSRQIDAPAALLLGKVSDTNRIRECGGRKAGMNAPQNR